MSDRPTLDTDGLIITVHIPLKLRRRGGRKLVVLPDGADPAPPVEPMPDLTILKALARAHRWRKLLEAGKYTSLKAIAEAEDINHSYVTRIFRLEFLAPDIVDAILNGRKPKGLDLSRLMVDFPLEWHEQRQMFGLTAETTPTKPPRGKANGAARTAQRERRRNRTG